MLSKAHDGLARQKRKRGDKQKRSTTTTSAPADASLFPSKKQHISSRADLAFLIVVVGIFCSSRLLVVSHSSPAHRSCNFPFNPRPTQNSKPNPNLLCKLRNNPPQATSNGGISQQARHNRKEKRKATKTSIRGSSQPSLPSPLLLYRSNAKNDRPVASNQPPTLPR
jgi:hypothetical protein